MEYDEERSSVKYGPWTYEHSHRREGNYWLFLKRPTTSLVRRVIKAITQAKNDDPRFDLKFQPNRVIHRGRNEPCWCGSGKKYKRCHASPQSN